jgi:DNA-binding PucR family transcriptional regulator
MDRSRRTDAKHISSWVVKTWPASIPLGLGEPGQASTGWRRTHDQAFTASRFGHITAGGVHRYQDIALIAAAAKDRLLLESLNDMYLEPLSTSGKKAVAIRATLKAYFAAQRNGVSAAAALGVTRQTVTNHLRAYERHSGRDLTVQANALELALSLEELGFIATDGCTCSQR